jgi:hypothetical protein
MFFFFLFVLKIAIFKNFKTLLIIKKFYNSFKNTDRLINFPLEEVIENLRKIVINLEMECGTGYLILIKILGTK